MRNVWPLILTVVVVITCKACDYLFLLVFENERLVEVEVSTSC